MRRKRNRAVASILGAALAAGAFAAGPQPAFATTKIPDRLPTGKSWTVTLLTGDIVKVRTVKGRLPLVSVEPGKGRANKAFHQSIRPDGHIVVTPADVGSLVGRVVDPELFDVTDLISQGYDDARAKDLPLIVQRDSRTRSLAVLGGSLRAGKALPSIGSIAAKQPKAQATGFGTALAGLVRTAGARSAAPAGIKHIWLDHKVKATAVAQAAAKLDHNLNQIGAPAAWKAGFTGKGVKVAVLDTGVDATHPDLKGQIAESANFSDAPDTVDHFGHGTHVAATIAGTGAASGGERKGVAPDASLLIGKVLNDQGEGTDSTVIAGMEWAAPRAKVINMSLGGWDPSDGTDPLSTAVDTLTKQDGSLFVVAAGNAGAIGWISSPAAADSALTVGAVDGNDKLADFSSRGPRSGRYAIKPEIVAPGVDIVAARAKGTAMGRIVDADYVAASGTSMATPHVVGAAALLVQQHGDWSPDRLKAALVGSADPAKGGDAFERGSGRVDAGAAVTGSVASLQAAPDLGTAAYPQHDALSTKLGWVAEKATKLALAVKLTDRQGRTVTGAATLSAAQVDVSAGGSATVTLQVDPVKLAKNPGLYAAEVTATSDDGGTTRTPVSFFVEPPSHTLTIVATPLPNTPADQFYAYAGVVNLGDIALFAQSISVAADGTAQARVPDGRYSVIGTVGDFSRAAWRQALVGDPEVVVDRDVTVTLDGAGAKPVKAGVQGHPTQTAMTSMSFVRTNPQGLWTDGVYTWDPEHQPVYVQPMGGARTGTFRAYGSYRLTAPGTVYDLVHPMGDRIPADPSYVVTSADQAKFARVDQRFAAFNGDTTKPVHEQRYGTSPEGLLLAGFEADSEVPAGSTRTDHLSTGRGIYWMDEASPGAIADGQWVDEQPFIELKPGSRATHTWGRQPLRPGPYSGTALALSGCTPYPTTRARGNLHVELVDLQARTDGFDCGIDGEIKRTLTLSAGGKKLGEKEAAMADFTVPAETADYTLRYDNDASSVLPVSTRTSTTWTFRSGAPKGLGSVAVPLLLVDYDLGLDLTNQPAGNPAVFTVARMAGSGSAKVTGLRLWTSIDDGKTWQAVSVQALGGGKFSAPLPAAVKGQSVSLRVNARDAGGSGIDQQIIKAYNVK
ncbi:MAG: hypothetical protein JWN52_3072 [Actinomycetia bacterium]|nr:hypothetical protein [Actinomycetes bacterium]